MRKLAADGDGLQFEVAAAQKSGRSDKLARRQILSSEIALINRIELVEQRQIRARNLYVHQIVHRHARLGQSAFQAIEHELDLILDCRRRLARLWIQPDSSSQIKCVSGKYAVAEWGLHRFLRCIERFARALRHGLRKYSGNAENSGNNPGDY